jgi:hypothetical protein
MSADAWRVCPRCNVNEDIGYKGNEFREDYEIGLGDADYDSDPARVYIEYRGECQRCGLLVEYKHEIPVTWDPPEANRPNGKATPAPRYWNTIPAGWFIQDPTGTWWEVLETTADGQYQRVKLSNPKGQVGEWPRRGLDTVRAVPGTAGGPIQGATDALFSRFDVTVLEDQA